MKFLQFESIFYADHWSVCDGVEREEGTTVAGGVTWSLGVALVLMVQVQGTRRFAHGGFKVARIYSSRWSVKICVPNIRCTSSATVGLVISGGLGV